MIDIQGAQAVRLQTPYIDIFRPENANMSSAVRSWIPGLCAILKLWLTYVRSGSLLSFLKPQAVAQVLLQFLGTVRIVKCKIEIVTQMSSTTLAITKLVAITGHWHTSSSIHTNREKQTV